MLMKLKPVANFINILHEHFLYESAFLPKSFRQSQNVTREKLRKALLYKKTCAYNVDEIETCTWKGLFDCIPVVEYQ